MKNLKYYFSLLALVICFGAQAQDVKKIDTVSFKVEGVCGMCKERIEHAALIKGVKQVEWNQSTQMLTAIIKPGKTSEEKLHESVAKAGHSTNKVEATDDSYNQLPGCCAYKEVSPH